VPRAEPTDLFAAAPLPVAALDDAQRLACLRLIRSENVGPATFRALINHYGGAREALAALPELGRRTGRARPIRVCPEGQAEAEIEAARRFGAHPLFNIEPGFPAPLAFADGSPPLIYVKGRIELLGRPIVSVVGSREASAAGTKLARMFADGFGAAGYVVCSGLARGIDASAHHASLATGTIAVLAGGIDNIYPPAHAALHAAIGERGCLVTEQPIGFQPRVQDFPRRNRIIAGIARAVVVIEAARRSGTLITARLANELGRDVFAVPGNPLDPRAEGTNQLIKDGAGIAVSADDVLQALGGMREPSARAVIAPFPADTPPRHQQPAPPVVQPVLPTTAGPDDYLNAVRQALGPAPINLDEIARATGLPVRQVQIAIMELALAGTVEFHGGQLVSLRHGPA
jgi:DNA processing protein